MKDDKKNNKKQDIQYRIDALFLFIIWKKKKITIPILL